MEEGLVFLITSLNSTTNPSNSSLWISCPITAQMFPLGIGHVFWNSW